VASGLLGSDAVDKVQLLLALLARNTGVLEQDRKEIGDQAIARELAECT